MKKFFDFVINKLIGIFSKIIALHYILKVILTIRYWIKNAYQRKHSLPNKVIISLTSYPPRYKTLHLTLKTLLSQSAKPNLVILWIYKDDFVQLPSSVLELQGQEFEIRTTDNDIRSYKKIIPILEIYSGCFIITADDDLYYDYDWLSELIAWYDPNKKEIIGHRAHRITFNANKDVNPYLNWKWCIGGTSTGIDIFLTGGGGVLYPPNALPKETLKSDLFMNLCQTSDDIWLYFMTRLGGFIPKKIPSNFKEFNWPSSQNEALHTDNVTGGLNDVAIKNLEKIYGKLKSGL